MTTEGPASPKGNRIKPGNPQKNSTQTALQRDSTGLSSPHGNFLSLEQASKPPGLNTVTP